MSLKTKYFPFAPGIPYKINGLYLAYSLNQDNWNKAMANQTIVVLADGGLFESFFSLALLELCNKLLPGKTLYWSGNSKTSQMVYFNGLAKSQYFISKEKALKYTVPLFFDAENRTYINCLLNYLNVCNYKGNFCHVDQNPVCFQMFRNSLISWDRDYIPKLRNFKEGENLKKWIKNSKFNELVPYVLLIPEDTGLSEHEDVCLDWTMQDIKSFISMIKPLNVVIMTNNVLKYRGLTPYILETNIENIIYLTKNTKHILAREPDYLLLSLMLSNSAIYYNKKKNYLNIEENKEYLGAENEVYSFKEVRPMDVYNCLKEKSIVR
jgi:hypothetical protein